MKQIQMVDLTTQYARMQREMDNAILRAVRSGQYINGEKVSEFSKNLAQFTGAEYVIPCANGTDALQIAIMALDLNPGDEIIIPDFTYAAAAEAVILLGLTPVMVDVDILTYNMDPEKLLETISPKTKAIIPVHLFGQCCHMEPIIEICKEKGIHIIEDNAQSIGAIYKFSSGETKQAGTIGDIGTLSFFPSKNLGCYGDGGAILTNDEKWAKKLKMIASHGQVRKYYHDIIGCNSRLDNLQAAVLNVKLKYLKKYMLARQKAAEQYEMGLLPLSEFIETPYEMTYSSHVYHQYTIRVKNGQRDELQAFLNANNIPSMIYYPVPVHKQQAFCKHVRIPGDLSITETFCQSVLSLPMHSELEEDQLNHITQTIHHFFEKQ